MASLGTPVVRRWLMWTAVILATAFSALRPRWRWAPLVVGTLLLVAALGWRRRSTCSTSPTCCRGWATDRGPPSSALGGPVRGRDPAGRVGAVGPALAGGAIAGIALALLLHVTVVVATVYGIYWVLERLVSAPEGASPSAKANLEEADTSRGQVPPGRVTALRRASG